MILLVDTSIWVDHFRARNSILEEALEDGLVITHEFVIGELACGLMQDRDEVLRTFESLPRASILSHSEFLYFLNANTLQGTGLNFVDIHLLASASLNPGVELWTRDQKLQRASSGISVH